MKVYTIKQVAEILQLKERTIKQYIAEGKLKAARFGTRVRISHDHLVEFFNSHVVNGDDINLDSDEDREEDDQTE